MISWIVFLLVSFTTFAAEPVSAPVTAGDLELEGATLEDLLGVKTTVATKKAVTTRQTPGIVTVIGEEEIRNMGARDLIDILRIVPGFHFGNDVQGVVGLGIRGLWAAEGKHLLVVDGVELNELQYAGTQYGNEFPVDQIKRIEIIRGPGSAIYGGFAELAVINITTKSGADLKGSRAQLTVGQWENTTARTNLSVQTGRKFKGGDYSVGLYVGQAKRGDGDYAGTGAAAAEDYAVNYSGEIDFEDADKLRPMMLNLGYNKNNFQFRFLYNKYVVDSYTMFGFTASNGAKPNPNTFESYNVTTNYTKRIGSRTELIPQLQINQQSPWTQKSAEAIYNYSKTDIASTRIRPSLTLKSELSDRLNILAGVEYIKDQHKVNDWMEWDTLVLSPSTFSNGTDKFDLDSTAVYVQSIYNADQFDVTLGARYEKPSETDDSFVPRIALTKAEQKWHTKFLYSQAFRSPVLFNLENVNMGDKIKPETAQTIEAEFGRALSSRSYLTANIFDTKIKDPIVYQVNNGEIYDNFDEAGSQGVELEYRFKTIWGQVQATYAFYQATSSKIPDYEVTGDKDRYLGLPQHMASVGTTYTTSDKGWKINPQIQYQGEKSAYDFDGSNMVNVDLDPVTLVNVYVSKEDVGVKGLGAGVGLFNLLNEDQYYAQPYNGGHGPVPGPSAELTVRLDYNKAF
jgi:outer membrane receptor protein involved in Fe transport